MLQQTRVSTVIPFWERWMKELPTVESLASAPSELLLKLWEGLGYYRRAKNLQEAAQLVLQKHQGKFPSCAAALQELPGIGPYTAGALQTICFNKPAPVVDGNIARVLARIFGIEEAGASRTFANLSYTLSRTVAEDLRLDCGTLTQSLMELGALICTPKSPRCSVCPCSSKCQAYATGRVEELPKTVKRAAITKLSRAAFIVKNRSRYLIQQRPNGEVNEGFWEFPNVALAHGGDSAVRQAAREFVHGELTQPKAIARNIHHITRYRITTHFLLLNGKVKTSGQWKTLPEIRKLPFSTSHRKILGALEKMSAEPKRKIH